MIRRAARYVLWQARLARQWAAGGASRHRAGAHYRAAALRRRLRRLARRRPTVIFALTEHFGDVIAAEPLVRAVRARHPEAQLVYVVAQQYRPLVSEHPAIDLTLDVRCMSEWYLAAGRTAALAEYDCHIPGRVCGICQSVTRPTGAVQPVSIADFYESGSLLDAFARASGVEAPDDRRPRLYLPRQASDAVDSLGLPPAYVVLHARSNQPAKRDWPVERWIQLASRMRSRGVRLVEVGLERVLPAPAAVDLDLTGRLSLVEACEVIRRASGFIGIDSGPAHAANAFDVPGVVLTGWFGRFKRHMPYSGGYADGSSATVVQYDGPMAELPMELAWQAAEDRFGHLLAAAGSGVPRPDAAVG